MKVSIRKKKKANGDYSLYLDIYHNGNRSYEFLELYLTKDKEANKEVLRLAESIRAKKLIEIQNYNYGFVPEFKKRINFIQYFETVKDKKPKHLDQYQSTLLMLKAYAGNAIELSKIDNHWLEGFKEFLLKEVSQNTAMAYFIILKSVLKTAVKDKLLIHDPGYGVSGIKAKDVERTYLVLDEIKKLAEKDFHHKHVKYAFLFSCFTGLRFSDIKKLTWQEIKEDRIEFRQKKTSSFEYLPMPATARQILIHLNGNIISMPQTLVFKIPQRCHTNVLLKQWAKSAEIKKPISFHTGRHTFATLSLTEGTDLYTVSKMLGHKNISTTQKYAKIVDKKKQEAAERLPVITIT